MVLARVLVGSGFPFQEEEVMVGVYIAVTSSTGEWISGAVCMYIAKYFVESYGVNATITDLMDKLEFVLVPFVNPDGYVVGVVN